MWPTSLIRRIADDVLYAKETVHPSYPVEWIIGQVRATNGPATLGGSRAGGSTDGGQTGDKQRGGSGAPKGGAGNWVNERHPKLWK